MKAKSLLLAIIVFFLAAALSVVSHEIKPLPGNLLFGVRWIAIAALALHGCYPRTLTTWILIAMVAGAAIGHDWPGVAVNLRVIGVIFLRLIKTIIAPLLFSTLVSGICRTLRSEESRPHGSQGDCLLRDRHNLGTGHRSGRDQHQPGRRRRSGPSIIRRSPSSLEADVL